MSSRSLSVSQIKFIMKELDIMCCFNTVKDLSKSDWKQYMQKKIVHKSFQYIVQSAKNSTKLKKLSSI